jgi:hypothetical protein
VSTSASADASAAPGKITGASVVSVAAGEYSPVTERALAAGAVASTQMNAAATAVTRSSSES